MGTFLDSFLGSVFEESWWCSTSRRVIHFEEHACEKCEEARRKGERVSGHSPSKCGLVCGRPVMNGSFVNLLSSSLTSVLIGVGLYFVYFRCSCLWHRVPCERKHTKHDSSTTKPNDATSVVYLPIPLPFLPVWTRPRTIELRERPHNLSLSLLPIAYTHHLGVTQRVAHHHRHATRSTRQQLG